MALNVSFSQGKELSHLSCTTSYHHFRTNSGIVMLTFRAWRQSVKLYEREIEIGIALKKYWFIYLISNTNSNSNLNYKLTSVWNQHEIITISLYIYIILVSLKLLLVWFCSAIRSTALLFSLLSWFILLFQSSNCY